MADMKPSAFPVPTALRRCVRVVAFLAPIFFSSLARAETWTGTDIGDTGAAGWESDEYDSHWGPTIPPNFRLYGAGADIQGTADAFRLMHTPTDGDVTATVRVESLTNTHAWAKAGVMIRGAGAANSRYAGMFVTPSGTATMQVRAVEGVVTETWQGPRLSLPCWVRLTRTGNVFRGFVSSDGTNWQPVAAREFAMSTQAIAGFAVCSHVRGTLAAAKFANADVNGSSVPPAAPTNVTAEASPRSAEITWTDNSSTEDGFRVYSWHEERHATYPELRATLPANTTSFTLTGLAPEEPYYVYVSAFRGGIEIRSDPTLSFTTPQDPAMPPETPDMGGAQAVAPHAIDVSWQRNPLESDRYETGYELERATDGTTFTRIAALEPNTYGYHDTGLTTGTTYTYRVRTVKETLYSAWSATASATALGPLAAPTQLTNVVDALTPTSLRLTWTDNSEEETRFEVERSVAGGPFALRASLPANSNLYADTNLTPNTTYAYRVRAAHSFPSEYSNVVTVTTPRPDEPPPPPAGWHGHDIGAPALAGTDSALPPNFTMQAGGTDIQGTADSFHYLAETLDGDGTLICRVATMNNTHSWAKAGVMMRASLNADAANVAMLLSPAQVCSFQSRATSGAATEVTLGAWVTPPYWVKLTRVGNTFTGYVSPDGFTWTQVGARTVVMPAQIHMGFASCSHNPGSLTSIAFADAQATGSVPPPPASGWTMQGWSNSAGNYTEGAGDSIAAVMAQSGDIYGASDSGVFVYRMWSGPATIVTRVNSVGNSDGWAKGGMMIRASLAPTAANAFVALTAGVGAVFQSRSTLAGSQTTTVSHTWTPGPGSLLKLVRGSGTISAFYSTNNGTTWTPMGSVTDDYPETIYLGYAASSHNPSASTTVTFAAP